MLSLLPDLLAAASRVTLRRLRHGPLLPSWSWRFEVAADRRQVVATVPVTRPSAA